MHFLKDLFILQRARAPTREEGQKEREVASALSPERLAGIDLTTLRSNRT